MPSLFASYLRVYEPLTAFDRDRQTFWRRYAREGRALGPVEGPVKQRWIVLAYVGAVLLPIAGLIIGTYLVTKGVRGHGFAAIAISIAIGAAALLIDFDASTVPG